MGEEKEEEVTEEDEAQPHVLVCMQLRTHAKACKYMHACTTV